MISAYLIDIMIMLIASVFAVPVFRLLRLGAVPGFLISGVAVGPSGLGLISNVEEIGYIAEIGVVLLLFMIGIELKPSRLWLMRRMVFGLGTLQVLITGLILGIGCHFLFNLPIAAAILVGPALALSSTAFVLQLLTEQKNLGTPYGRASFGVLLLQDLSVVPLLALAPLLAAAEFSIGADIGLALINSVLILVLIIFAGRYLVNPILRLVAGSRNSEVFTASAVLIVLGSAIATEHAGLSMGMGAFLAGLLIADSSYRHQVIAEIQPFRGLLLGLFFMSMGMSLNLDLLAAAPVRALSIAFLLIGIKAALLLPLALAFGIKIRDSLAVALILAQGGEFALILFSLALQIDLLTEVAFQELLMAVLLSMVATPLLFLLAKKVTRQQTIQPVDAIKPTKAPIVLAGFGRVGHRIGGILAELELPFVAVDLDITVVETERTLGHPVFYGDITNPGLLKSVGAGDAEVIVVTLNKPSATLKLVETLRHLHPNMSVYARGHALEECRQLRAQGASGVVSENIQASLGLAHMALTKVGVSEVERDRVLSNFRQAYNAQIEEAADN